MGVIAVCLRWWRGHLLFVGENLYETQEADEGRRWPAHRPISALKAKHLQKKEGIATVPTNRLLLVFDSRELPFNFALEMFEVGHVTPQHTHPDGHELFYILQGEGVAICDGYTWPVKAGDTCVFPVQSLHGLNNTGALSDPGHCAYRRCCCCCSCSLPSHAVPHGGVRYATAHRTPPPGRRRGSMGASRVVTLTLSAVATVLLLLPFVGPCEPEDKQRVELFHKGYQQGLVCCYWATRSATAAAAAAASAAGVCSRLRENGCRWECRRQQALCAGAHGAIRPREAG